MQIVRDDLGPDAQEPFQPLDGGDIGVVGGEVRQIADVRPDMRAVTGADAEGVLEQRAAGEHRR